MEHSAIEADRELEVVPPVSNWPIWPWMLLAVLATADLVWLLATPISLTDRSIEIIVTLIPLTIAALLGAKRFERFDMVYVFCAGLAFIFVAWPTLRLFNHLSMTTAFPWADAMLSSWDEAIRFDWFAYIYWLDGQRWLLDIMNWTYIGLNGYSIFFFAMLAAFPDRRESCFEFIALFVVSATICMVIGMFFPAQAAMIYYAPDLSGFEHVHAGVGTYHIELLDILRETPAPILDLDHLPGLVTFPSFHTAMGVVLIYACRRRMVLLIPSLAINLSMIAATPLYGSHYLVDIIGGVAAALATIAIVRRLPSTRTPVADWDRWLRVAQPGKRIA